MNPAFLKSAADLRNLRPRPGQFVLKKTFEIPAFASEQFAACQSDLAAVAARWRTKTVSELWFDRQRSAFSSQFSGQTRAALFGNWMVRLGKAGARFVRTRDPLPILDSFQRIPTTVNLPRDTVILLLHEEKRGLVMASAEANLVAKLRYGQAGVHEWKREIAALSEIKKTRAREYIPQLVDHGRTPAGCAWTVTQLAPNHHPIIPNIFRCDRRRFLSGRWRQFLRLHLLPVMETVYNNAGMEEISADNYLQSIGSKIVADDTFTAHLLRKLDKAYTRKIARTPVFLSRIHGDLYPRHIHRSGDRWWILDWGESDRRELFLEILDQHIRRPASYSRESLRFWSWLNNGGNLSGEFGSNIVLFVQWIQQFTGAKIPPDALRFQILVHLLKRIQEESAAETGLALMQIDTNSRRPIRSDVSSKKTILADLNLSSA